METSSEVINKAEPEVLAKVNNGRSPYSELYGAIGEARGWNQAIEAGQTPISGLGKASLPSADYIRYDPSGTPSIVLLAEAIRLPCQIQSYRLGNQRS